MLQILNLYKRNNGVFFRTSRYSNDFRNKIIELVEIIIILSTRERAT